MNNKLKLFYIFIIVVLLGSIVHQTKEMDMMDMTFMEQEAAANKHINRNLSFYLELLKKNLMLKHDLDALAEHSNELIVELDGLKHDFLTVQNENIALKKALTEK